MEEQGVSRLCIGDQLPHVVAHVVACRPGIGVWGVIQQHGDVLLFEAKALGQQILQERNSVSEYTFIYTIHAQGWAVHWSDRVSAKVQGTCSMLYHCTYTLHCCTALLISKGRCS